MAQNALLQAIEQIGREKGIDQAVIIHALEDAYAAADLLVVLPIYEPCSNVVAEALAADLPVITTRCNGACELIREGKTGSIIGRLGDPVAR